MSDTQIFRLRRLRPWVVLVVLLGLAAATLLVARAAQRDAQAAPVADQASTSPSLHFSTSAHRGQSKALTGATVKGKVYVTVVPGSTPLTSVEFRLDTALGKALVVEKESPYDFAGGAPNGSAKPFDTTKLSDGRHAILAGVTLRDGAEVGVYSHFTVANGKQTPPPTTPPKPPTSTPTAPPSGGCKGFPNPACTGVPAGTSLTTIQGDLKVTKANEVVEAKRITGRLIIMAKGVTVRNSEVHHGITGEQGGRTYPYKVSDTTVGPPSGCDGEVAVGMSEYTATRVHIRNFGDGFRNSGDNILIEDSYIKLCSNPGDHSDGVQGYKGGKNVVVRHTTIDQREAQDVTSPVFFADGSAGARLENNLLAGGGYTVRLYGTGYTFKGNKIVKDSWKFGPVASDCGGIDWADNQLVTIDSSYQVKSTVGPLNC